MWDLNTGNLKLNMMVIITIEILIYNKISETCMHFLSKSETTTNLHVHVHLIMPCIHIIILHDEIKYLYVYICMWRKIITHVLLLIISIRLHGRAHPVTWFWHNIIVYTFLYMYILHFNCNYNCFHIYIFNLLFNYFIYSYLSKYIRFNYNYMFQCVIYCWTILNSYACINI